MRDSIRSFTPPRGTTAAREIAGPSGRPPDCRRGSRNRGGEDGARARCRDDGRVPAASRATQHDAVPDHARVLRDIARRGGAGGAGVDRLPRVRRLDGGDRGTGARSCAVAGRLFARASVPASRRTFALRPQIRRPWPIVPCPRLLACCRRARLSRGCARELSRKHHAVAAGPGRKAPSPASFVQHAFGPARTRSDRVVSFLDSL